ncbi:CD151 family protein [Megaselia abdita]
MSKKKKNGQANGTKTATAKSTTTSVNTTSSSSSSPTTPMVMKSPATTSSSSMLYHQHLKRRKKGCCGSVGLAKCMLHIFNLMFLVSGFVVFGVAVWTLFWKFDYICLLTTPTYKFGVYGFGLAGALAIFGGFLGCCGIFYEKRVVICIYTLLLGLVFLLELFVGGLAYFYESQIQDEIREELNGTFLTSYGIDEARTRAIDMMQIEYKCCGAIRFEDWRASYWFHQNESLPIIRLHGNRLVPDSCCITITENCGKRDHPSNIPYTGCIYRFTEELRQQLVIIGAIGLGICSINVIGMILACCLFAKLSEIKD